jgi:hypothetical protein
MTRHDCLPSLLDDMEKWTKIVHGEEYCVLADLSSQVRTKISCTYKTSPMNQPRKDHHMSSLSPHLPQFQQSARATTVEGLYCKRPIQCLASSEILTPSPPHRPASVYLPAFGAGGGDTLAGGEGVGVNSSEDARHCFVLYICTLWPPLSSFSAWGL